MKSTLGFVLVALATIIIGCSSQTPGTTDDPHCGDGVREGTEECDGDDLDDATCESREAGTGILTCTDECTYDTSGCTGGDAVECGNHRQEEAEECDGIDLVGTECTDIGFTGGALDCKPNCRFDPSGCTGGCGNGFQEDTEECDDADVAGETCASLGLISGDLDCTAVCTFDTTGCSALASCDNAAIEYPEDCDGVELGGETCVSLGYLGGSLMCDNACAFDESGCHRCGNGIQDVREACDGTDLATNTCLSLLHDGGTLVCNALCELDESGCTDCGDGVAEGDEHCDDDDHAGEDCASLGLVDGTLACKTDCTFDTASCAGTQVCGNDAIEYPEACDNAELDGATCETLGWVGGTLVCTALCTLDESGCLAEVCSNGTREGSEECDGSDLAGASCASRGFVGGALACAGDCTFDESGCLAEVCNNGTREGSEECDGLDHAGQDCSGLGYDDGVLTCAGDCTFDDSACTDCGDDDAEAPEACDGDDLAGQTCASLGLIDGTLVCTSACELDVSGCSGTADCGNGEKEGLEECDDDDFGVETCESLDFDGGDLACNEDCEYVTAGCRLCGDDVAETPEECDGGDLAGRDCASLGFARGELACDLGCLFDTSACVPATVPVCVPIPTLAQVYEADGPAVVVFTCTDEDGDTLLLESQDTTAAPPGTVFVTSDGPGLTLHALVTLTPDHDDAGETGTTSFDVSFVITDAQSNDIQVVQNITFDNPAPEHTPDPVPDRVLTVGQVESFEITFSDPDSDGVTVNAGTVPDYIDVSVTGAVATVTISPTSAADDHGSPDVVSVIGDDGQQGVTTAAFTVTVNQAPIADAGADIAAAPGDNITLDGTGSSDPDGDPVTCLWSPGAGAPLLDDPTSCTPSLTGGACNDSYTYTLVVNDGYVDSAPGTVQVTIEAIGPYVSKACDAAAQCGDIDNPWCTIQAGVDAALANGMPEVYVMAGVYDEDPAIGTASGASPDVLGGYTDFATMARAAAASCDTMSTTSGATIIRTNTATGIVLINGNTSLFERFCVRANVVGVMLPRKVSVTIIDSSPVIRDNIIDTVCGNLVGETVGIEIYANDIAATPAPVLELNVDAPNQGMFFGGDGSASCHGVLATGRIDLTMIANQINAAPAGIGTQTVAVQLAGGGSLSANTNRLDGGAGTASSFGLFVLANLGNLDVELAGNVITGGGSPADAVGVWLQNATTALLDHNDIRGRRTAGSRAVGLYADAVESLMIASANVIKGGEVSGAGRGVQVLGNTRLTVDGNNEIRGGIASATAMVSNATLFGIDANDVPEVVVTNNNQVSGADVNDAGVPIHGGLTTVGIWANNVPSIDISGNDALLGGSPELPFAGPGSGNYFAGGVVLRNVSGLNVSGNAVIQGCAPYCGPGSSLIPSLPTAVGLAIDQQTSAGAKTIEDNGAIIGGPAIGGATQATDTLAIGVMIAGPADNAGVGPWVTVDGNGIIAGNNAPDDESVEPANLMRPDHVRGMLISHANVTVSDNTTVEGGRSFGTAVGIYLVKTAPTGTSGTITTNGEIIGNPYEDATGAPYDARGIVFVPTNGPNSSLMIAGLFDQLQPIGGGFARADGINRAEVVGVIASNLDFISLKYNRIWGGVVPNGESQEGARFYGIRDRTYLESNSIEACGYGDPTSGAHHPGCDALAVSVRSVGLALMDSVGMPTYVANNRIFGGFSRDGSTGLVIIDGGDTAGGVQLFNNYINAQGPLTSGACGLGSGSSAYAIFLSPSPGGLMGTGALISIFNNIIDAGGRACQRYGIFEYPDVNFDLFTALTVTNNAWVQANPDRDIVDANAVTWAYHEVTSAGGHDWCLAGSEVIQPTGCLNGTTAPTTAAGYELNYEGDPEFGGNDLMMSEIPGFLSRSDFNTNAAVLAAAGTVPVMDGIDFENDPRPGGEACEIGHDEW